MIRYNEKKHCFETVSTEEHEKELFEKLKKTYGDVAAAFDPIKEILRNMDKNETTEVNFIDFDIDDEFEVKQSDFDKDKSKKEALVENVMDSIDEILSKHLRSIRVSIEQQIRRAYKQGYCDGIDDAPDAPGEYDSYREGFIDGVAYCKRKTWQIRPENGLVRQKMEDSI